MPRAPATRLLSSAWRRRWPARRPPRRRARRARRRRASRGARARSEDDVSRKDRFPYPLKSNRQKEELGALELDRQRRLVEAARRLERRQLASHGEQVGLAALVHEAHDVVEQRRAIRRLAWSRWWWRWCARAIVRPPPRVSQSLFVDARGFRVCSSSVAKERRFYLFSSITFRLGTIEGRASRVPLVNRSQREWCVGVGDGI